MNVTSSVTRWRLLHAGEFPDSGAGIGDVFLNYRYQLVGSGDTRVAFSLALSLILPCRRFFTGPGRGQFRCADQPSLERRSQQETGQPLECRRHVFSPCSGCFGRSRCRSAGYNFGQSFIWLAHTRFNVMLETVFTSSQVVVASNRTEWTNSLFLSPGIRWAYNFKNGLQIVPGIGVPLGVGPSAGERAVFLYLSFEHPFRKLPKK